MSLGVVLRLAGEAPPPHNTHTDAQTPIFLRLLSRPPCLRSALLGNQTGSCTVAVTVPAGKEPIFAARIYMSAGACLGEPDSTTAFTEVLQQADGVLCYAAMLPTGDEVAVRQYVPEC